MSRLMTLKLTQSGFARLGLGAVAFAIVAALIGVSPAGAFSMETINGDASGGSRYSDPGGGNGVQLGQGGPTLHFGAGPGSTLTPFSPSGRVPGAPYGSSPSQQMPDPYNLNNPNRY